MYLKNFRVSMLLGKHPLDVEICTSEVAKRSHKITLCIIEPNATNYMSLFWFI